jgi:hypothetical protein
LLNVLVLVVVGLVALETVALTVLVVVLVVVVDRMNGWCLLHPKLGRLQR